MGRTSLDFLSLRSCPRHAQESFPGLGDPEKVDIPSPISYDRAAFSLACLSCPYTAEHRSSLLSDPVLHPRFSGQGDIISKATVEGGGLGL